MNGLGKPPEKFLDGKGVRRKAELISKKLGSSQKPEVRNEGPKKGFWADRSTQQLVR